MPYTNENTLFNNELKTEMTTIIPLASRHPGEITYSFNSPELGLTRCYILEHKRLYNPTRVNFFANRVVNNWDSLTEYIVEACLLNIFKNSLDRLWGHSMSNHPMP